MIHYMKPDEVRRSNVLVRISGVAYASMVLWNMQWVLGHLNSTSLISSVASYAFILATALVTVNGVLTVINNWRFKMIRPRRFGQGEKPEVAIIIPTYGEAPEVIINTLASVVAQDWPKDRRLIVVSDDGHSDALRVVIGRFKKEYGEGRILYHRPHKKGHPERLGDAKAGNLNSALNMVTAAFPNIRYVETRDADDLVGNSLFLSYCLELLERDPAVSFVQTIKECLTKKSDPFSNQESVFYRRTMVARHATNAVFPCGSGLVWRISEVRRIGGFPGWNLVEDLHSGYEILRRGGQGAFLPVVGAVAQVSSEDIPNFYKQRGTWAIDTLRLFYWKNPLLTGGLDIWQKLQFFDLEFSYLLSFAMLIFIMNLVLSLAFNVFPVSSNPLDYMIHFVGFGVVFETFNVARARGISLSDQWRTRQIWIGLMPVYIVASFRALLYGPRRKPSYRVTRKYHEIDWYWKETLVQKIVVATLVASIAVNLIVWTDDLPMSMVSIMWSLVFIFAFQRVIRNSWHGIDVQASLKKRIGSLAFRSLS